VHQCDWLANAEMQVIQGFKNTDAIKNGAF